MADKNFFISADEHVQEHPAVWTKRLSAATWGNRIPHVEQRQAGIDRWLVDGREIPLRGVADCGALMQDRSQNPQRWEQVPGAVYDPKERLKAMDRDGVDYAVLYPTVGGAAGQNFGRIEDPELELACVQAYNDWLLDEWASVSERFIPQCITPLFPIEMVLLALDVNASAWLATKSPMARLSVQLQNALIVLRSFFCFSR